MSDQKISEFRQRAQMAVAVAAPDPDPLLQRGRALRRRRQLSVLAVAACAAVGIGLLASGGGVARTDQSPVDQPTDTADPRSTYVLETRLDAQPDATVELVGPRWTVWDRGAVIREPNKGVVSWGFQYYEDTKIDPCRQGRHAKTLSGAISQLSHLPGTVTRAARPTEKLGLTGTYLQLSVPIEPHCPNGKAAADATLMANWSGVVDPTATVDVWLLEDGDRLLILTRGVRGNPTAATLENLDLTLDTLQYVPTP